MDEYNIQIRLILEKVITTDFRQQGNVIQSKLDV